MKSDISTPVWGKTTENTHAGSQIARWAHALVPWKEIFKASTAISEYSSSPPSPPEKLTKGQRLLYITQIYRR